MTVKRISTIVLFIFVSILLDLVCPVFHTMAIEVKYTITVTARPGGKIIAPGGTEITGPSTEVFVFNENSSAEFKFEPDSSKLLSDVILDSISLGPLSDGAYTFTAITGNHVIMGVFRDNSITIPEQVGDDQIFTSGFPLSQSFKDIISKGISYTAPVVPVDSADRARNGDAMYLTFFRQVDVGQWEGNLKKYGLAYLERPECDAGEPEWTVVDKYGDIAVDCDGVFLESSVSFWSNSSDGGLLDKGGAGQILLDSLVEINPATELYLYQSFRNIKTYLGDPKGAVVSFNSENITKDGLGVEDNSIRNSIINYIYGYSYDADPDGRPVDKRDWVLGDIIHSEPEIIDYFDPGTGDLQYRYIAAGSNDGMLHIFTDTAVSFGGKTYFPGEEVFAFIPTDLLPELYTTTNSAGKHTHMVDGSPCLFRPGTINAVNGYYHKTLVFGERRGGRSYWALDVTNPDPSAWTVKWHITGGNEGISSPVTYKIDELGFTWSKPFFTEIKISETENKNVMIFAGGYDPVEDGFPESFLDANNNGEWDAGEAYAATVGGTEGYDKYNPTIDEIGRGIFVIDMDDGSLLFKAGYEQVVEKTTGTVQTYNEMKYCFPADVSVIPFSESNLLMYAADIYGQVWRVEYNYYADIANSYKSDLSKKWTVKRIFKANPGSDLASGTGAELITPFIDFDPDTPEFDNSDQGRKTFYSPDISYYGNEWTNKPVLYFGTGDRAHPRYTMISNRFYTVVDNNSLTDETDLLNLTCNELDVDADADNDGAPDDEADDESLKENLKALFYNRQVNGFYRIMDKQGFCKDSSTDHRGEHILSQPTLYAGKIYFTAYQPVLGDPSNPESNVFSYSLDYSYGTSAFNYDPEEENEYDRRDLEDSFFKIGGISIPSDVLIITKDGESSGFVNNGAEIIGVAGGQSMYIPGLPGGVSQMLWEIE